MSDTPVTNYNDGDIAWVKLGSCWWPGEVKDINSLPSEVRDFKKAPLVIVKFFDEDSYEYIKSWTSIYPYNCERKNDFIKKGMAQFRSKSAHMEKFPKDVSSAEVKVGGNPNILSDPIFLPEKKRNYVAEVFGTPSPKRSHKSGDSGRKKGRPSLNKTKKESKDKSHITHRRFLGYDDYEAYVCIQYPGKDREGDSEDEEVRRINREPEEEFNCHSCGFKTKRIEVMILHTKSHIQGVYVDSPKKYKAHSKQKKEKSRKLLTPDDLIDSASDSLVKSSAKRKKDTPKKKLAKSSVDDLNLELCESSPKTNNETPKERGRLKKTNTETPKERGRLKKTNKEEKPTVIDIRSNLLAEWDDSDNEEIESSIDVSEEIKAPEETSTVNVENGDKDKSKEEETKQTIDIGQKEENKENKEKKVDDKQKEEAVSTGHMDKDTQEGIRSCFDFDEEDDDEEIINTVSVGRKIPRVIPEKNKSKLPEVDDLNLEEILKTSESFNRRENDPEIESAFKDLMETTAVPKVPEIIETLKPEQNFHDGRTIKFPDKMELLESPLKNEKKESEVATKLTNPKKRFVKSFEDFELEMRRKEEQLEEELKNKAPEPTNKEPVRYKSKETTSKTAEAKNSNSETEIGPSVQFLKLKDKIMLKINEDPEVSKTKSKRPSDSSSHRTPRSKILESYRKQKNSDCETEETSKTVESQIEEDRLHEATEENTVKKIVPPKKNKWSRRGSQPKKEENLLNEDKVGEFTIPADTGKKEDATLGLEGTVKQNKKIEDKQVEDSTVLKIVTTNNTISASIRENINEKSENSAKDISLLKASNSKFVLSTDENASKNEDYDNQIELSSAEGTVEPKNESNIASVVINANETVIPTKIQEESNNIAADLKNDLPNEDSISILKDNKDSNSIVKDNADTVPKEDSSLIIEDSQNKTEDVLILPTLLEETHEVEPKKDAQSETSTNNVKEKLEEKHEILSGPAETESKTEATEDKMESDLMTSDVDSKNNSDLTASPGFSNFSEPSVVLSVSLSEGTRLSEENIAKHSQKTLKELADTSFSSDFSELPSPLKKNIQNVIDNKALFNDSNVSEIATPPKKKKETDDSSVFLGSYVPIKKKSLGISFSIKKHVDKKEDNSVPEDSYVSEIASPPKKKTRERILLFSKKKQKIPEASIISEEPASPKKNLKQDELSQLISEVTKTLDASEISASSSKNDKQDSTFSSEVYNTSLYNQQQKILEESPESLNETTSSPKTNKVISLADNKIKEHNLEEMSSNDNLTLTVSKEMLPVEIEDIVVNRAEELQILPKLKEDLHVQKEETIESAPGIDSFLSSSKDEFSTIGSASLELPEDAICSPPIKNKTKKDELVNESHKSKSHDFSSQEHTDSNIDTSCNFEKKRKKRKKSESSHICSEEPKEVVVKEETVKRTDETDSNIESEPVILQGEVITEEIVEEEIIHSDDMNTVSPEETVIDNGDDVKTNESDEHKNEMEVKCANTDSDDFKFSIQTNLSNFTKAEELSALTLATLSEIQAEKLDDALAKEKPEETKGNVETDELRSLPVSIPIPDAELVPIEGNLTVVSEKDLADGQVEITSEKVICPKKPATLSNFSMDFSDSSNNTLKEKPVPKTKEARSAKNSGTEFTEKAMTNKLEKLERKKANTYERLELLDILEGNSNSNSNSEQKFKESYAAYDQKNIVQGICDFEECIPSQIVCAKPKSPDLMEVKMPEEPPSSKLLERLTDNVEKPVSTSPKICIQSDIKVTENVTELFSKVTKSGTAVKNPSKYIIKSNKPASVVSSLNVTRGNKPIILSEQIIKPANSTPKITPKPSMKRSLDDIEDVEAFVIHKASKKIAVEVPQNVTVEAPKKLTLDKTSSVTKPTKSSGKAKILQQTIITPQGEIIQPTINTVQTDDNVFDINSMPIVLSDEILTPESIENMPIVLGSETVQPAASKVTPAGKKVVTTRTPQIKATVTQITSVQQTISSASPLISKPFVQKTPKPRILHQMTAKVKPTSALLPSSGKTGKYIIIPSNTGTGLPHGKVITTKPQVVKRTETPTKMQPIGSSESVVGNKIMIVTNQQGQKQRLLLTPAQQKMLGYQSPTTKVTKTIVKGGMAKSILPEAGPSGLIAKSPLLAQRTVAVTGSSPSLALPGTSRNVRSVHKKATPNQKVLPPGHKPQKTILIKNQHGQTVRKIQGTDDEELDKQVAEQLEAIKASARLSAQHNKPEILNFRQQAPKTAPRRSYAKKAQQEALKPKPAPTPPKPEAALPALAPISPAKKPEPHTQPQQVKVPPQTQTEQKPAVVPKPLEQKPDRPLNQLVIQDAMGNQTTITEGQILALPSETVDGQPQSYMLVTLDESGNLTPLNNEALMSLDPNLGLGGDINNMVLQIDQGQVALTSSNTPKSQSEPVPEQTVVEEEAKIVIPEVAATAEVPTVEVPPKENDQQQLPSEIIPPQNLPSEVAAAASAGQQLIVTGDPIATQKFLESLTEGTTDLANILASAEGSSILIQADGQQILINTNSDNQMLLSTINEGLNVGESTEGGGNPIFSTQPNKSQDILAAALADTDVFQQEHHTAPGQRSQLSPNSGLYPMNVGNVLETSLTLSSPIMTPLEVPSTNSKKIDDEADILNSVPKNVDLPITITDPNISQTVAQQQVASLIANELQTNLELSLPISEATISVTSTDMNSPSYVYSLPTLDETVDITQKPFNSSMPLLTEDVVEETTVVTSDKVLEDNSVEVDEKTRRLNEFHMQINSMEMENDGPSEKMSNPVTTESSFIDEGLCTLGGEMCSSLSEPPPDMFDLPGVNANFMQKHSDTSESNTIEKDEEISSDLSTSAQTETSSVNSSEGSCEIPVQPQIVAKLSELKRNFDDREENESKRCKYD